MIVSQFTNAKKKHVKMKVSDAEAENEALSSGEMSVDKAAKIINFFWQLLIGKLQCLMNNEVISKIQMSPKHTFC